jgi:hypothetical protein
MCATGDRLRARLVERLGDDPALLRLAMRSIRRDLPRSVVKAERDDALRRLAVAIHAAAPGLGPFAIAELLAEAAQCVEQHEPIAGDAAALPAEALAALRLALEDLAAWAPRDRAGGWAPSARTVYRAIKGVF